MDGRGGADEELTAQETALYDRQIRVWGVDAQKRFHFPPFFLPLRFLLYLPLIFDRVKA
jgi:hypothetical protein